MTFLSLPDIHEQISLSAAGLSSAVTALLAAGKSDAVSEADVQTLMIVAIKLYVAQREAGADFLPFGEQDVTATEVLVSAGAMLKAARLEVFELTMWNGFGTI